MLTVDRHYVRLMDGNVPMQALPTFTELTFTQEDMGVGAWTLEASLSDNQHVLSEWLGYANPCIQVWAPGSDQRAFGYLKDHTIIETAAGLTLRAGGIDWLGLLDDRLIWPSDTLDLSEFWQYQTHSRTDTAERVARVWISQIIEAASYNIGLFERELPWPSDLEPLAASGASVTVYGEALPTLQRIRELLTGTQFTARLVPDVLAQVGRIVPNFVVGQRPKAATPLSVSEETLGEVSNTFRSANATKVIGIGAEIGAGPAREVAEATNLTPAGWQRRYVERFINESSLSGADLLAACQAELAVNGPTQSVVATNPRAGIWGRDLDIGWLADVAVRDYRGVAETVELPVVASTLIADKGGHRRTIEFGAVERRDLAGVLAAIGDLQDEVERLKRKV